MKAERRMKPEWGIMLDGVWIPYSMLEELADQGEWDSQLGPGSAYIKPNREQQRVLVAHQLAVKETRGGLHRGPGLQALISAVEFPALSSYVYVARPGAPEIVQARQWAARTNVEQLAEWCEGWTYTGNQHGHTSPPWAEHTCLNLEVREDSPKGHADPADWIVRHEDGTYEIIPPGQFTAGFDPYPGDGS
jgi:hypothetical protein